MRGPRNVATIDLRWVPSTTFGSVPNWIAIALSFAIILLAASVSARPLFRAPFRAYAPLSSGTRAVTLGDFDSDGHLDIAVGSNGTNSIAVMLNDGNGEFTNVSYITSLDYCATLVAADLNGDSRLDLVAGNFYGSAVSVFLGRGDGSFLTHRDYATGADPRSVAIGDVDADGHPDLVVANSETFYGRSVSVLLGNGNGTFDPHIDSPMDGVSPSTVALADFDEDGRLDLVAGYSGGATFVYVMRGLGDGRFGPIEGYDSAYGPTYVATGDIDGDGHQDFVSGGTYDGAVSVHLGRGDGTFATKFEIQVPGAAFTTLADVDRDGHLDVLTAAAVMRGLGGGAFAAPVSFVTDYLPALAVAGDLDGDGRNDLVTPHPNPGAIAVLIGRGDGTFGQLFDTATANIPQGIADGDIDHDGRIDLAVASTNSVTVLIGDGDGGFANRIDVLDHPSTAVALTDLDRDGSLDLVTVNGGTVSTRLGTGSGTFGPRLDFTAGPGASALATGDFNEDGKPDAVTANTGTWSPDPRGGFIPNATVTILLGAGDGTFDAGTEVGTGLGPIAVSVADLNRDGHTDVLVVSPSSSTVSALLGNGDGTFQPKIDTATESAGALAIGDFNADGVVDAATTNYSGVVAILLGNGDGHFSRQEDVTGLGYLRWIGTGDWDRDGIVDLAVVRENGNDVRLLKGHGDGSFDAGDMYGTGNGPEDGLVTDLNQDGHADIVVANYYGGSISTLINLPADHVTSAELSLVDVEASAQRVRIRWYQPVTMESIVAERRTKDEGWKVVGALSVEQGLLVLEDDAVVPGSRYAYRLRSAAVQSGETWVDIPRPARLALSANFRRQSATVALTLTSNDAASLDVYDPAGRRVLRRTLAGLGPGEHDVVLPESSAWKSGYYFARIVQGAESARAKWRIVR